MPNQIIHEQFLTLPEINSLNDAITDPSFRLVNITKVERTEINTVVHCDMEHGGQPYKRIFNITEDTTRLERTIAY